MVSMSARTRIALHVAAAVALVLLPGMTLPAGADSQHHTVGAFFIDYLPPDSVSINQGDTLTFVNTDPFAGEGHTFTMGTNGVPAMFDTDVLPFGESGEVRGVSELQPGQYLVKCRIHPIMRAALFVGPPRDLQDRLLPSFLR